MPIIVNLDLQLVKRKMRLTELAERVGITIANLSVLKQGKARAIRFSTLEAICRELECQPGDILEYRPDGRVESAG
jgi:putative transcriptional regulator